MNNIRVLSLSIDNKNPLMWAHYGEHHKGICIGYDLDKLCSQPNLKCAQSVFSKMEIDSSRLVEYRQDLNDRKLTNILMAYLSNMTPEALCGGDAAPEDAVPEEKFYKYIEDIIFSKQGAWSYEKEYRIIVDTETIHNKGNVSWDYLPSYTPGGNDNEKASRDFQYFFWI